MGNYQRLLDEAEKDGADMAVEYLLNNMEHFTSDEAGLSEAATVFAVSPQSIHRSITELKKWSELAQGIHSN